MAGWHLRLYRRVKLAPGLTVNLSKSGPSLSVGPHGSKITVGRRGVRQTIGLPGTGVYMTRQLSSPARPRATPVASPASMTPPPQSVPLAGPGASAAPAPEPVAVAAPPNSDRYELHYGLPLLVGLLVAMVLVAAQEPVDIAIGAAILATLAGLLYEALWAHHPVVAKILAALVVGAIGVLAFIIGFGLLILAAAAGGANRSRRR